MNGVADQEGVTSQRLMSERPLATEICGKPTGVTHPNLGKNKLVNPPETYTLGIEWRELFGKYQCSLLQ